MDVQRAMSGAQKAGFDVARCDVHPDGTISVVTTAGAQLDAPKPKADKQGLLGKWLAEENEA